MHCWSAKSQIEKSGVSTGRRSGFLEQDIDSMLELVEEHLQIAREEWDHVLRLHEERCPKFDRSVDSLKRKFFSLRRTKVPTGDPTISLNDKRAKQMLSLSVLIFEREGC